MTTEDKNIPLSDDVEIIGPGQMLKDARIAQGLTENQVAEQLNLRLSLIKDIETEQFDAKVPETFMRGYLKNYANLVGVNYLDIKSSYESLDVANRQGDEMKSFSRSTQKQAENNMLKLISIILVIVLIAVTVVWWLQQAETGQASSEGLSTPPAAVQPEAASQELTGDAELSSSPESLTSTEHSPDNPQTPLQEAVTETDNPTTAPTDGAVALSASTEQPIASSSNELTAEDVAELRFTFSGDCWVNIFDASGERLAWGIKKADYVMTLQGQPPFNITLGKPELVEIDYNQQAIDMSQYQQGQIAKFQWPQEPTNEQ